MAKRNIHLLKNEKLKNENEKPKRLAYVTLDAEAFLYFLGMNDLFISMDFYSYLPDDAKPVDCYQENTKDSILVKVVFESSVFPLIIEGQEIPELKTILKD